MARKRIGALLEERGLITEFQLVAALSHQRKWKGKLGRSLIELGYLEEQKLYEVLAEQLGMTLVDLRVRQISLEVLGKIPHKEAQALKAVAVEELPEALVVAVAEPDLPDLLPRLTKVAGQPVKLVLGTESAIEVLTARIPEKTPVAAVQPIKKAFIRNNRGEIEPLETSSGGPFDEPAPLPVQPAMQVSIPEPAPPPADEAPIALDEGEAIPPAPVQTALDAPPNLPLGERVTPPAPSAPPAFLPAEAAPELPADDLWAMPEPIGARVPPPASGAGLESGAAALSALQGQTPLEPAGSGMDLPPPPSLDLADLPPPPPPLPFQEPLPPSSVLRVPSPAEAKAPLPVAPPVEPAPSLADPGPVPNPEIPLPEFRPEGLPPEQPFPEVPLLDLLLQTPDPASASPVVQVPSVLRVPSPADSPSPARAGDEAAISSLLDDLGRLTAPHQEHPEEADPALQDPPPADLSAEAASAKVERSAILPEEEIPSLPSVNGAGAVSGAGALTRSSEESETPPWLEKPRETMAPVEPLPGLMTEDVKAEAVAFQEEIHHAHAAQPGSEAEPKQEVAFEERIEGRIGKLEEEMRKLRETVESLVLKIK